MKEHIQNEQPTTGRRRQSPSNLARKAILAAGAVVLVCAAVALLFHDSLLNTFIKPKITQGLAEAYPAYSIRIAGLSYGILRDRVELDSVTVHARDGTFSSSTDRVAVSGIGWMHLLWGGSLTPEDFTHSVVDAHEVVLNFPRSQNELRCTTLRVSVPDSAMALEGLALHPSGNDDHFFAESDFSRTRFRLVVPTARVMGVAFLDLVRGKSYRARSAHLRDASLDVLINKDKVNNKDTSRISMPSEILSSIEGALQIDSLIIVNGQLNYGERMTFGRKPALITFEDMQVLVVGIANRGYPDASVVLRARGKFMRAGKMSLLMSIPVGSRDFSFTYSGSLGEMNLSALNPFLETAEEMRITAGVLQGATFDIRVVSGRASGDVKAEYRDLTLAAMDRLTGSQDGLGDVLKSFVANNFTIRGSNSAGQPGSLKIGEVAYTLKRDDVFLKFAWFALRSGVGDVVGF